MTCPNSADLPAVLAGLAALGFDVTIDHAPGLGWTRLDRYASDADTLDAGLRLAGARFGHPTPDAMTGGWLVGDIAAAVTWPAAAALLTHGCLLVTDAHDVYLPDPSSGQRLAVRITAPGTPRPGSPEAFAAGIVSAVRPIVEAVHRRTRRGRHALWGTVTDMIAAAFHRIGDHHGRSKEARLIANAAIDGCEPLVGGTNWREVTWLGGIEHTRIRNICCLWYRTPGGDQCLTCPRVSDADRKRMLESRSLGKRDETG